MKFIVIGLGNFGLSISQKLTALGHEVIGVDKSMARVDEYKSEMSYTICLNPNEEHAIRSLPLKDSDAVIVTIGQDIGESVICTALLKQLGTKRVIVRCVTKVHENILAAMGVDEIVDVTTFASQLYSLKWSTDFVRGLFRVDDRHGVFETELPPHFVGGRLASLHLNDQFRLKFVALKRIYSIKKAFGDPRSSNSVVENADETTLIEASDRIVVYGKNKDYLQFADFLKL